MNHEQVKEILLDEAMPQEAKVDAIHAFIQAQKPDVVPESVQKKMRKIAIQFAHMPQMDLICVAGAMYSIVDMFSQIPGPVGALAEAMADKVRRDIAKHVPPEAMIKLHQRFGTDE